MTDSGPRARRPPLPHWRPNLWRQLGGLQILVTGAGSGIGRSTARALAEAGAEVTAVDIDPEGLAATARGDDPATTRQRVQTRAVDVADPQQRAALFPVGLRLDAVVNDAGVGWVGLVADIPPEEIDRMLSVNLAAVIHMSRLALDRLRPGGHLVNIGSVLGWVASPPLTVYAATKFGVHGFSTGLRREAAGRGLHVTEILPGPIDTAFFGQATARPAAAQVPRFPAAAPERVAAAVCRALQRPGWPGYRTVAVPRWAGISRLGALPGGTAVTTGIARVARSRLVLRPGREAHLPPWSEHRD